MTSNRDRRILLVTRYFPPLDSVATMRMHAWAKYLDARGWDVSVLTTSKRGQVVTPLNRDLSRFSVTEVPYFDPLALAGVDKSAFVSQQTRPDRGIGRKLQVRLSQFYRQRMNERMPGRTDPWIIPAIGELRRQSRAGKTYQYVISSYGPPSALVVGHAAAKLFGATWVADYRDLWLENHAYAGLWPFTLVERLIETRTVQRRADLITTVSDGLATVLRRKFPGTPIAVIENGFDRPIMDQAPVGFFDDQPRKFRVVYTGTILRKRQDPSPFFRALKHLSTQGRLDLEKIEVLFFGSSMGDLPQLIETFGLSRTVRYCGAVDHQDAVSIQKSADLLLFLEAHDPHVDGILTGKLFEYLFVETPIFSIGARGRASAPGKLILKASGGTVCGTDYLEIGDHFMQYMGGHATPHKNRSLIDAFARDRQVDRLITLMQAAGQRRKVECP